MGTKPSIHYSEKSFGKMYASLTLKVSLYQKVKNRFKLWI